MSTEEAREIKQLGIEATAGFKNLIAIRDFVVKTREEVKQLRAQNEKLEQKIMNQDNKFKDLEDRLRRIQVKVYQGGATT